MSWSIGAAAAVDIFQRRGQHSGRAIAALQRVALVESGLERRDPAGIGKPLDGRHRLPVGLDRQHQAAAHGNAADLQRAGAADTVFAADMGTGKPQIVAQEIDEIGSHGHAAADALAIDRQVDLSGFRHH